MAATTATTESITRTITVPSQKPSRAFFALLFFCILTLWVPDLWPVSLFLGGTFLLTIFDLIAGGRRQNRDWTARFALLLLCLLPAWVLLQLLFRTTVYAEPTRLALLAALSYPCVVYLLSDLAARHVDQARRTMVWFAFVVSVIAILQNATAPGKVFWLFQTPYTLIMGPILSRNHWAAFVEAVLPIALYYARSEEHTSELQSPM